MFLPIVQRELLQAARRKTTFRIRLWTGLAATGISLLLIVLFSVSGGRNAGRSLFDTLTVYSFGLCLLAGVVLTADTLSEERREGTLGLLFLTHLKTHDIVLGKLLAMSLHAVYGLLTLFPILGLALLLGGVTGAEFWRMALALLNALFFSLAAGVCVSAAMRDSHRAMVNTLGLVLLLTAGLPLLAGAMTRLGAAQGWSAIGWISPYQAFSFSAANLYPNHSGEYWKGLLVSHAAGWGSLAGASLLLSRNRRDRPKGGMPCEGRAARRVSLSNFHQRAKLLSQNPVLWLRRDDLRIPWAAWMVVAGWGVVVALVTVIWPTPGSAAMLGSYVAAPFGFLLKVLVAFQACSFFAEGRRNGALELLLCTPLTSREIVSGQFRALWRTFGWPVTLFVVLLLLPGLVQIVQKLGRLELKELVPDLFGSFAGGIYAARSIADLAAVCWVGMALALTLKRPKLAPAYTVLFVLVLPSILCWFDLFADLVFIAWGASKCQMDLRRVVAGHFLGGSSLPATIRPLVAPAATARSVP